MSKKLIIGGVVLLLMLGGGAFLLLSKTETKSDLGESDTVPTQWSQAGDYEIKEVPGQQTVVTNSKAGFSFKVPVGWSIEDEGDGTEYFLNLLHPSTKFDENSLLIDGCFIGIETTTQQDKVINLNVSIDNLLGSSNSQRDEKVVQVGEYRGLYTSLISSVNSDDPEIMKKVRNMIMVEVPLDQEIVVDFQLIFKKNFGDECIVKFDELLATTSFK